MKTLLSKEEQAELRQMVDSNIMQKAFMEALGDVYKEQSGSSTLEGCAMSYSVNEGARSVLNKLMLLSESKKEVSIPNARRLRTIKN
jgi:hypothetical protein